MRRGLSLIPTDPRALLLRLFNAATDAVRAERILSPYLPTPPVAGRTVVLGAGKAAAAMARVVDARWERPLSGLVVVPAGHGVACNRIEVLEAGHPLPDAAGVQAAGRIIENARALVESDLCLCLVSGGGSSLLPLPAPGIGLEDKRSLGDALLRSGATISEINCVRKHLSAIKGGRLAAACFPARVVTLVLSDVPGNDPAVIASGPTVADPTTCRDALAVLEKHRIPVPERIERLLRSADDESPGPGDPRLSRAETVLVATAREALEAAADAARGAGIEAVILGDAIEGEAREVAREDAAGARKIANRTRDEPGAGGPGDTLRRATRDDPAGSGRSRLPPPPLVLLSGGETTVTVRGSGHGGPNTEYLLALASALDGHPDIHALACDTDGIDGSGRAAGALISPDTPGRAAALGLDMRALLADNDSGRFFEALGDLVITGPTLTNVNDFRAILITPSSRYLPRTARLRS